jgi:hypothetical protein
MEKPIVSAQEVNLGSLNVSAPEISLMNSIISALGINLQSLIVIGLEASLEKSSSIVALLAILEIRNSADCQRHVTIVHR